MTKVGSPKPSSLLSSEPGLSLYRLSLSTDQATSFKPADQWPGDLTAARRGKPTKDGSNALSRSHSRSTPLLTNRYQPVTGFRSLSATNGEGGTGAIAERGSVVEWSREPNEPGVLVTRSYVDAARSMVLWCCEAKAMEASAQGPGSCFGSVERGADGARLSAR